LTFFLDGDVDALTVGLKIESPWLAQRLTRHFQLLFENNLVARAF